MKKTTSRLEEWAREEREKLRGMPLREAAGYIWDYYKLWIIGLFFLVFIIVYLGVHLASGGQTYRFYITFAGTRAEVGNRSKLWREYSDRLEEPDDSQTVEFNNAAYFDYARDQGRGNRYYDIFVSFVDAGVVDAVTMPEDALTQFGATGRLLDLDSEACSGIRAKYGDRFLYCKPLNEEYGDTLVAVGIDISDSILMKEYRIYDDSAGCALGIGAQSGHIEEVEAFLDLILEQ